MEFRRLRMGIVGVLDSAAAVAASMAVDEFVKLERGKGFIRFEKC